MSFVLTRNGDRFDPRDPESFVPDFRSVMRTLCRIPRFSGNVDRDYTVAHHSLAGARLLRRYAHLDAARIFLVHDAHESVMGDVPSPVKAILPDLVRYEKRLERHFITALIGPHYEDPGARSYAKAMDHIIVAAEAQVLGLDDGWTAEREDSWDPPAEFPSLAEIRREVEAIALLDRGTFPYHTTRMGMSLGIVP